MYNKFAKQGAFFLFFQSIMHGMKIISVDASAAGADCFHEKYAQDKIWNANIFGQSSAVHFSKPGENLKKLSPRGFTFQPQFEPAPHTRAPIVLSDGNLSPQKLESFSAQKDGIW